MQTLYVDGCLSHIHWQLIGDQVPPPWSIANCLLQYLILSSSVSPIPLSPPNFLWPLNTSLRLLEHFLKNQDDFHTSALPLINYTEAGWGRCGWEMGRLYQNMQTKTNINKRRGLGGNATWPFLRASLRGTGDIMRQYMTFFCATSSSGDTSGYQIPVWLESISQRGSDGLISQAININQSGPARGFEI